MALKDRIAVFRVESAEQREQALEVLASTYRDEKRWVGDEHTQLPEADLSRDDISWFTVTVDRRPVGVLRVLYDPPLELYAKYGFELIGKDLDVEQFVRDHRIAEIGRFAVLPEYRKFIIVVAALMKAASTETVTKGYTHYITDVFEDDPHSPYQFHTRVMGFEPVATHEVGELNSRSRRITLVLDLKASYMRLKKRGGWIFRLFTGDWDETLHSQMTS
ncbi:MAG: GNAT family N-acetyltransferase [Acidobacteriota bacterium]|nr:GNAT family N-acetyltransferase [Acidobacteriota bacterium]MDQ7088112.1 GNAT family N-acetyltransferase [Acidobacteriota bacterium]